MNIPNFIPGMALVGMAALTFSTLVTSAAEVPDYVNGDIFVGVRAENSPGNSDSYLVKIGNDTTLTSTGALTLGNLGADLSSKYGSNWHTRADLHWGVFGVRNPLSTVTLYSSRQRTSPSVQATPWPTLTLSQRQNTRGAVSSVIQSPFTTVVGYETREATENSPVATFQGNGNETSSYNFQVTNGPTDFGTTSGWESIEGSFGAGASATVLDIFRIAGTTGVTLFGTLTIDSSGVITFTLPTVAPVDNDGDGFFDFEEALAGTSDNDGSDFFRVNSVVTGTSSVSLSFNSIPARSYQIFYSEDLAGPWELIDTVTAGPYVDTNPVRTARSKGFYKVGVTTP